MLFSKFGNTADDQIVLVCCRVIFKLCVTVLSRPLCRTFSRLSGKTSARQCAVGGERDIFLLAIGDHFAFFLAEDQVVMPLDGNKPGKAFLFSNGICLGELPCKAIGNADISCFACLHNAVQPIQNIVNRCVPVPHMIDIEVHVIHAQVLQACVDHVLDVLLSADPSLDFLLCPGKEFRCKDNVLTLCKIPQRPADILLTGAALIGNGRIIKIDAQLQSPFNDFSAMLLIDRPAVLASSGVAKTHTSHADTGYIQV